MTFTLVPAPGEVLVGSPLDEAGRAENERQHRRRIPRGYAIATKPVTVAQWQRFLAERPPWKTQDNGPRYSPEPECPIEGVSWYTAAAYCNWLSGKEGIPRGQWCYPERIGPGMKVPAGHARRTGYRLPAEAEWEYACRAGSATSRYYGSSLDLLPRYAWFLLNSPNRTWPVGQKRPNDLGLFDMHGNIWTWCHDAYFSDPKDSLNREEEDEEDIKDPQIRALRGGGFDDLAPAVRSSDRYRLAPATRNSDLGVRPCRTYY
jgi:formylglycine-generating enzyme required for sulfatase activity